VRLRRILPLIVLALPAACAFFGGSHHANILLISVDSMRFDAISRSLGAAKTPHIHGLAADGVSFPWCFSHSPAALPAHTALFSSRTPTASRVTNNGQCVPDEVPMFPEWLAKHGYVTFGAVSLATLWPPEPGDGGAQNASVMPSRAHPDRDSHALERGFSSYRTCDHVLGSAAEVNARLLPFDYLAQSKAPWFVFAQYSEPHAPYEAYGSDKNTARVLLDGRPLDTVGISDTQWWKKGFALEPGRHHVTIVSDAEFCVRELACAGPDGDLPPRLEEGALMTSTKSLVLALENPSSTPMSCVLRGWIHDVPDLGRARNRYKLEIEHLDRAIGALLDDLRAHNLYDDTCIVLTADHGEELGEHGKVGHGATLFDELLRVPLIIKPPHGSDALAALQKVQLGIVRHVDLVPTILDIVGGPQLPGAQGVSLLSTDQRIVEAETHPPEAATSLFAMRDTRYKLVFAPAEDRFEMFDMHSDTLELENVFPLQGQFRSNWQTELRKLAQNAPQNANVRMGIEPPGAHRFNSLGD
jgi:arylsulfatase A-like enzyme